MPLYRLNVGQHIQNDPETGQERTYVPGEVIEGDNLERFNGQGMTPKFERLHEDTFSRPRGTQGREPSRGEMRPEQPSVEMAPSAGVITPERQRQQSPVPRTSEAIERGEATVQHPQDAQERAPFGSNQPQPTPPRGGTQQPAHQGTQPQHPGKKPNLDQMSVRQLQEYAHEEEIDLGGKTKKEEIIATIKQHQKD